MFGYYLRLALASLKHNKVLTLLMVLTLGLGIGASITTLTVLKLLSGDPLPQKSARLFTPELDPLPDDFPLKKGARPPIGNQLSYTDAMHLMHAGKARRQAAMARMDAKVAPRRAGARPFFSNGLMTTADFFSMFDVPFKYGNGWSARDGENRAHVAVISNVLNDKLFKGRDSVGEMIRVNDHDYRVVGVIKHWSPQPRFYTVDLGGKRYGEGDAVFVPLQSALADRMRPSMVNCWSADYDADQLQTAPCAIVSMWVELASASDAAAYKAFLAHYAQQQVSLGRFDFSKVWFPDLMAFLVQQRVVPDDARLQTYLAFGFLLICIVNTVGLLLAKCLRRSREIGVRRALGASRGAIFVQFMIESAMVGLAGGVRGLIFAELGLVAIRHQPAAYAELAHLDAAMFGATFAIALIASLVAGLLPAWRACVMAPAPQLKAA